MKNRSYKLMLMEHLKVYNNSIDFWREVSPHLKIDESKNNLCLGMSFLFNTDSSDCVYQSALFNNETFLGALVVSKHKVNINLLPSSDMKLEWVHKLIDDFFSKFGLSFSGIVAEKNTALIFSEILKNNKIETKINMRQGIYRCQKVKFPKNESLLNFRLANSEDIPIIGVWINNFHFEAVPHDPPIDGSKEAEKRINKKMIYVLESENGLVSMAAWSRDIGSSCSVNLVYTPPNLRKNGYASFMTASLTNHLLNNGKVETNLYTDLENSTSNKIYMNIGYEWVCDSLHLAVK